MPAVGLHACWPCMLAGAQHDLSPCGGGTLPPWLGFPSCLIPLMPAPLSPRAEEPQLSRGAGWLNDHYQAILLEQQEELTRQHLEAVARQQAQQPALPPPTPGAGSEAAAAAAKPASQDTSPTSVR